LKCFSHQKRTTKTNNNGYSTKIFSPIKTFKNVERQQNEQNGGMGRSKRTNKATKRDNKNITGTIQIGSIEPGVVKMEHNKIDVTHRQIV
jgi:hypothetical protein